MGRRKSSELWYLKMYLGRKRIGSAWISQLVLRPSLSPQDIHLRQPWWLPLSSQHRRPWRECPLPVQFRNWDWRTEILWCPPLEYITPYFFTIPCWAWICPKRWALRLWNRSEVLPNDNYCVSTEVATSNRSRIDILIEGECVPLQFMLWQPRYWQHDENIRIYGVIPIFFQRIIEYPRV